MATIGYARVSSRDQNPGRQVTALQSLPDKPEIIFIDRESGKNFNRPQYQKMLTILQPGDTLYISSLDRLGRNYLDNGSELNYLTNVKKVEVIFLDMQSLRPDPNNLFSRFIYDMVIIIKSFAAENERDDIHKRQREAIDKALADGVQFGRKPFPLPENFEQIVTAWKNGELQAAEAARSCGWKKDTFYHKADKFLKDKQETEETGKETDKETVKGKIPPQAEETMEEAKEEKLIPPPAEGVTEEKPMLRLEGDALSQQENEKKTKRKETQEQTSEAPICPENAPMQENQEDSQQKNFSKRPPAAATGKRKRNKEKADFHEKTAGDNAPEARNTKRIQQE